MQLEMLFKKYQSLEQDCGITTQLESSSGRVFQIRASSKKLVFLDVRSSMYKCQVQLNLNNIKDCSEE